MIEFSGYDWMPEVIEWASVAFSLSFTIFIAQEKRIAWLLGFFGSVLAAFSYYGAAMVGLTALQVFFAIMGIYGFLSWGKADNAPIITRSVLVHAGVIMVGLLLVYLCALPLGQALNSVFPFHDAFIALFSVLATFMMAWKWKHHWVYWIVIDFVWLYVNIQLGFTGYSVLSVAYIVLSVYGLLKWYRQPIAVP